MLATTMSHPPLHPEHSRLEGQEEEEELEWGLQDQHEKKSRQGSRPAR